MQNLLELAPLAVFVIAINLRDIYFATGALMVSMLILLMVDYAMTRKIPTMHWVSAGLVFVLGSVTLLLHDKRFIQWKPTILFWGFGIAFLLSRWVGKQTLTERFMRGIFERAAAVEAPKTDGVNASRDVANPETNALTMTSSDWRNLNWVWVAFYFCMGALNLLVVRTASERVWGNFKGIGITVLTMIFVMAQAVWITRRGQSKSKN